MQGLLIIEASRSHSDTRHSVGHLWTSDQPDLTAHNIHKRERERDRQTDRQTDMLPAVVEPATPASERPQTHALDRAATAIGNNT